MFAFFRIILILLSLAALVLSIFGLVGSYKNESYLTPAYLIDFQLNQLNLSAIIDAAAFSKRDSYTDLTERDLLSDIGSDITQGINDVGGYTSSVEAVIQDIINSLNYTDLGLSDVYTVSYWGYCKGSVTTDHTYDQSLNKYFKPFDNSKLNITWCSPPKAAYAFDPLTVFKQELNNTINSQLTAGDVPQPITTTVQSELKVLLEYISYDNLNLPGSLQKDLTALHGVTKASFIILLVTIGAAALSVFIQIFAFFLSPHSCCLSFLNFLFEGAIFLLGIISAALATGTYLFTRKEVNNATKQYGIKSFLSVNFYAYLWSAAVASLLVVIFSLLGHCCGLFGTGRRRYRAVPPPKEEAAYEHKGETSSESS